MRHKLEGNTECRLSLDFSHLQHVGDEQPALRLSVKRTTP
jgi:hypothetical protein